MWTAPRRYELGGGGTVQPAWCNFRELASSQIGAYGACLKENVQGLTKGICDKEFNVLRSCASKSLAKVKAGGRR